MLVSQDLKEKDIPINLLSDAVTPQEGDRKSFQRHTKTYSAYKGIYQPSLLDCARIGVKEQSRDGFCFTSWQMHPSLLLATQARCHWTGDTPLCQGEGGRRQEEVHAQEKEAGGTA